MDVTSALPRSRPLTYDDLATMPDDGHRYEIIDGTLLVTPSPQLNHQLAVVSLVVLLREACPPDLVVLVAPFDVVLAPATVMQPDVLVARRAELTDRNLPAPPVLAVEVLSPSTRRIDLGTKRLAFEAAGVPSYWVIDPDEPSLSVFELEGAAYRQVTEVRGDDGWDAALPFAVRMVPRNLVD
jgi:Uma2 family endonuclease